MPFHVGGHKPNSQSKRAVSIKDRLLVTMCGALLIFGGVFRIRHGSDYVLNWWREPVYAYGSIVAGVFVIPVAWMPTRWIDRAVAWAGKKPRAQ